MRYHKVLVLGMCFFVGGTKFSEQGFGASEYLFYSMLKPRNRLGRAPFEVACGKRPFYIEISAKRDLRSCPASK